MNGPGANVPQIGGQANSHMPDVKVVSIPVLQADIAKKELQLTEGILGFNQRVSD